MRMKRREFIRTAMMTGAAAMVPGAWAEEPGAPWTKTWDAAFATLAANIKPIANFDQLVLFEGSTQYRGTWQECGPHESLAYAQLAEYAKPAEGKPSPLEVAKNTHRAFFSQQREDGQIPANLRARGAEWGMIQMVVPIAATAWDLSQLLKDEAFLAEAYSACSRWDAWLRRYRDTRRTGLVEAFCCWDTGQDDSPRWHGVSNGCPGGDAKNCPTGQSVPRLCPDLSATVFGARVALGAMAKALGKKAEAQKWIDDAEHIRGLILAKLWCEEDASFYDVDPDGNFVRIRTVANLRVPAEHVMRLNMAHERKMFNVLWERQLHNPKAFWTPYPFPSIAMNDPKFVLGVPHASWNGGSQALTALRTLRWMDYYGKGKEQRELMQHWCDAILRIEDFREQMEPVTGTFTGFAHTGYSPCALVFLHFAMRLGHAPALHA
ncbi:MAG TPA: alpha-L-rhamnosidase [Terracidiphilus sp.]|nr:alpha-L-rhamnosidase [Terracidiphilus sp.]